MGDAPRRKNSREKWYAGGSTHEGFATTGFCSAAKLGMRAMIAAAPALRRD
jgi:hypothetical protein